MRRFLLMIPLVLLLAGCQNLMGKGVSVGGSTAGVNIVMGTDPSSGNFIPIPQKVAFGWGSFFWLDLPMTDDSEAWYYSEEPLWFREGSSKTFVYMRSGNGVIKGRIRIQIEDNKLLDIPLFKVYSPFTDGKEVLIDGKPAKQGPP